MTKRQPPNDPLAEPTPARRVMAAMRKAGLNKTMLSQKTGIAWSTIHAWDKGKYQPELENLRKVAPFVGYSEDELMFGRRGPGASLRVLDERDRRDVLREIEASPDERAAWAEHEDSAEGRYQDVTRIYVVAFVKRYRAARAKGTPRDKATAAGWKAAVNAVAEELATSEGREPLGPKDS